MRKMKQIRANFENQGRVRYIVKDTVFSNIGTLTFAEPKTVHNTAGGSVG